MTEVWGEDRVGIRLSPFGTANDSGGTDPVSLYTYLIRRLASLNLAYLHLVEPRASAGRVRRRSITRTFLRRLSFSAPFGLGCLSLLATIRVMGRWLRSRAAMPTR